MAQNKRPAENGPSNNNHSPDSLSWVTSTREAVLRSARIEHHAEVAGFRRGRGGWHCGQHDDARASCSIRGGRIRCWVCNQGWNVIDLHMLATGEKFLQALRTLAAEYGIAIDSGTDAGRAAAREAQVRADDQRRAFPWRTAYLKALDELLVTEKAALFDPTAGSADESLIRNLSQMERMLRAASGPYRLARLYRVSAGVSPELTARLVEHGETIQRAHDEFAIWLIDRLAEMEDRW